MPLKKKKGELVPGTAVECKSGRWLAYYEHRTDIIANGENETDARKNLRKMYEIVIKHEQKEIEKKTVTIPELPKSFKTKSFKERLICI